MKVILLQDIQGLGSKGREAEVKKGYAHNFLIPKKLATPLTAQARADARESLKIIQKKDERIKKQSVTLLHQLQQATVILHPKVSEQGRLFKAVSEADIKNEFIKQGIKLRSDFSVRFHAPLKERGEHTITLRLSGGLEGAFSLKIA